jgi:hypothetical protein
LQRQIVRDIAGGEDGAQIHGQFPGAFQVRGRPVNPKMDKVGKRHGLVGFKEGNLVIVLPIGIGGDRQELASRAGKRKCHGFVKCMSVPGIE